MPRLCERPGCAEPATVAYGFDASRCVVWFEPHRPEGTRSGGICRRHADAMVVPRGWWLDDRREAAALFPTGAEADEAALADEPATPTRLAGGEVPEDGEEAGGSAPVAAPPRPRSRRSRAKPAEALPLAGEGTDEPVPAWEPVFDQSDDLGGQLDATTPLLARAFGRAEPRPVPRRSRKRPPAEGAVG